MSSREEIISGYRKLADILEANPDLPLPDYGNPTIAFYPEYDHESSDGGWNVKALARSFSKSIPGNIKKHYDNHSMQLQGTINGIKTYAYFGRDQVCEKVKTGTQVVIVDEVPEGVDLVKVKKIVDVFEWKCTEPLLAVSSYE